MPNQSPVTPLMADVDQNEETARRVLDGCIEQLSNSTVGDSQWIEACHLLGQIDPAFVPMQIEALPTGARCFDFAAGRRRCPQADRT